jgi:hypothetical protein
MPATISWTPKTIAAASSVMPGQARAQIPARDRKDAEGQHPAPMLPDPPDRLGRAGLR